MCVYEWVCVCVSAFVCAVECACVFVYMCVICIRERDIDSVCAIVCVMNAFVCLCLCVRVYVCFGVCVGAVVRHAFSNWTHPIGELPPHIQQTAKNRQRQVILPIRGMHLVAFGKS